MHSQADKRFPPQLAPRVQALTSLVMIAPGLDSRYPLSLPGSYAPVRGPTQAYPNSVVLDYRSDGSITICLPERDIVSPFDSGRAKLLSGSYLALVRQVWASRDRRELDTLSRQLYDLLRDARLAVVRELILREAFGRASSEGDLLPTEQAHRVLRGRRGDV
jgi:hypothetical protein